MTIGSGFNYPADIAQRQHREKRSTENKWRATFPNPPDLCFDYRALVEQVNGIAHATEPDHKICVIGAGITGLTTARELYRCGFTTLPYLKNPSVLAADTLPPLGAITPTRQAGPLSRWVQ